MVLFVVVRCRFVCDLMDECLCIVLFCFVFLCVEVWRILVFSLIIVGVGV